MIRTYVGQNVYDALQERLAFLFGEFENIYISLSGGKDSGVLLNSEHRGEGRTLLGLSADGNPDSLEQL